MVDIDPTFIRGGQGGFVSTNHGRYRVAQTPDELLREQYDTRGGNIYTNDMTFNQYKNYRLRKNPRLYTTLQYKLLERSGQDPDVVADRVGLEAQRQAAKNRPFHRKFVKTAVPIGIGLGGALLGTAAFSAWGIIPWDYRCSRWKCC